MTALAQSEAETLTGSCEHIAFLASEFRRRLRRELVQLKSFTHWRGEADKAADRALEWVDAYLIDALVDATSPEARAADFDMRSALVEAMKGER